MEAHRVARVRILGVLNHSQWLCWTHWTRARSQTNTYQQRTVKKTFGFQIEAQRTAQVRILGVQNHTNWPCGEHQTRARTQTQQTNSTVKKHIQIPDGSSAKSKRSNPRGAQSLAPAVRKTSRTSPLAKQNTQTHMYPTTANTCS